MSTHQHRLSRDRLRYMAMAFGLLVFSTAVQAKDKKIKAAPKEPKDAIEVVGHIPLTNGPPSNDSLPPSTTAVPISALNTMMARASHSST